jgi:hypothetical protein
MSLPPFPLRPVIPLFSGQESWMINSLILIAFRLTHECRLLALRFLGGIAVVAMLAVLSHKNAKTAGVLLLLGSPDRREPSISAASTASLAVNLGKNSEKQRDDRGSNSGRRHERWNAGPSAAMAVGAGRSEFAKSAAAECALGRRSS